MAYLQGILLVFVDLLLCVPEPFIDLLLFKFKSVGELSDLFALGWAACEVLEEGPERLPLYLRLALTPMFLLPFSMRHGFLTRPW